MAEFKFHISENKIPTQKAVQLKKDELEKLKSARIKLLAILTLEELYDQIIESFLEFKTQLYSNSLSLISDFRIDYNANHEVRSKLNRQLFNTLNLSKLYLDTHYHEDKDNYFVKDLTNDVELHKEVTTLREKLFVENSSYRLGCGLRNLTQHSTLPIQTYTVGTEHIQDSKDKSLQARFHLPLAKENLLKRGIKKSVLKPFSKIIDLHKVMDGYIYALSQMHIQNRKLTEPTITNAEKTFISQAKEIEKLYGKNDYGVGVFENDERLFYLELEWYKVVNYLQQKHAVAINYGDIKHTTYSI